MTTINELTADSWQVAEDAGWHNMISDSTEGHCTRLCLIHSEVSEAMEALRERGTDEWLEPHAVTGTYIYKPMGLASELADILIRVADFAGTLNIDLEQAVAQKMAYNAMRSDVPSRFRGVEGTGKRF